MSRKPLPAMPIRTRHQDPVMTQQLEEEGWNKVLARVFAARGITNSAELKTKKALLSWRLMKGVQEAADQLIEAIKTQQKIVIVADYDSDGATSCAICYLGLKSMGAIVEYLVPNRFIHGYGLTVPVVDLVQQKMNPQIILTVDNGISSWDGVERAREYGIKVIVTDHHLPGDKIPNASAIVNPNQPGCTFPSKNMAGCGVAFYVMAACRELLKAQNALPEDCEPIQSLLDLVAIGTIADVVKLDENNRLLARLGLERIRTGKAHPGVGALFAVARRSMPRATSKDIGFSIAPRINAAGRLDDMSIGIQCLIANDFKQALELGLQLDDLNSARKNIESEMQEEASENLMDSQIQSSICVYSQDFHEGVIGIVAGRIKEREHRPTIVFAPAQEKGLIKGSGRSIPGFHLRDALDLIYKKNPKLLHKFGGHAMAAGMTIQEEDFEAFKEEFEEVCSRLLTQDALERFVLTDGDVEGEQLTLDLAEKIAMEVWGQGFPEPLFHSRFKIKSQRLINQKHLKLELEKNGYVFEAMWFFQSELIKASEIDAVYSIESSEFKGNVSVQLQINQAKECWDTLDRV